MGLEKFRLMKDKEIKSFNTSIVVIENRKLDTSQLNLDAIIRSSEMFLGIERKKERKRVSEESQYISR